MFARELLVDLVTDVLSPRGSVGVDQLLEFREVLVGLGSEAIRIWVIQSLG